MVGRIELALAGPLVPSAARLSEFEPQSESALCTLPLPGEREKALVFNKREATE